MRRERTARLLGALATLVATLVLPAGAVAAVVTYPGGDGVLQFLHIPGTEDGRWHDLTIEPAGGDVRLFDAQNDIIIDGGTPCAHPGADDREVVCDGSEVGGILAQLGDLPDRIDVDGPVRLFACGAGGNDLLRGGAGDDQLGGGRGRDEVRGGGGSDTLAVDLPLLASCQVGDDRPDGEVLEGGDGADQLYGGGGADRMDGGAGDDGLMGYAGDDVLDGGEGADFLVGFEGADVLRAGDGEDILSGGAGDDRMSGGAGGDSFGFGLTADADGLGPGDATVDVVEYGDDVFDGGEGDDTMVAGPGEIFSNLVDPFAVLRRGFIDRSRESTELNGADTFIGGPGASDQVSYINRGLPISVTLDGARNDGSEGERDRVDPDVERIAGGAGDDRLVAAPGGSFLFGDNGADTLVGDRGPDTLRGGISDAGADVLEGHGGDDDLGGGPGNDILLAGPGDDASFGGDGRDLVEGGPGDDGMEGGTGADRLRGGEGADCLHGMVFTAGDPAAEGCPRGAVEPPATGADGDDVLTGGPGRDRLFGGPGRDTADYTGADGPVLVALAGVDSAVAATYRAWSDWDDLALDVEGARGGPGDDTLLGNARDNTLEGGRGDDQLDGGSGADRLQGGSGRDVVVARDGVGDGVACGPGNDLALVDGEDDAVSARGDICEHVDGAGAAAARLPRLIPGAEPGRDCSLRINLQRVARSFRLFMGTTVPFNTRVDATACAVRLKPPRRSGVRLATTLRDGAFRIRRRRAGRAVAPELVGGASACATGGAQEMRRLRSEGGTGVLVQGRAATTSGRAATWTTIDRCDGTAVEVTAGTVRVVDRRRRRVVVLGAGERYLARAPAPEADRW